MIGDQGLRNYADVLERAGFAIYESTARRARYFRYSRVVDGKECFGYVQAGYFGGYSHTMPIRPSIEHGSSMWVDRVPDSTPDQGNRFGDPLSVEAAAMIARPKNHNPLVGWQANYDDPRFRHLYQRRGAAVTG